MILKADFEKRNSCQKCIWLAFWQPSKIIKSPRKNLIIYPKVYDGGKERKYRFNKNGGFINVCRHIIENGDNEYATKCRISIFEQLGQIIQISDPERKTTANKSIAASGARR